MKRLVISAPWGNYLQPDCATPTLGTYTWQRRAGFWRRAWRVLSTVRYYRRLGGYVNRLGLPSPDIACLRHVPPGAILSIHGFTEYEWCALARAAAVLKVDYLELNLSCPNIRGDDFAEYAGAAWAVENHYHGRLITKLGPLYPIEQATSLYERARVSIFHLCNTLPVPGGGLSGKAIKPFSLRAIEALKDRYGSNVTLIGGGGITSAQDAQDYVNAGADHVAIGSWLLNPLNWRKVRQLAQEVEGMYAAGTRTEVANGRG